MHQFHNLLTPKEDNLTASLASGYPQLRAPVLSLWYCLDFVPGQCSLDEFCFSLVSGLLLSPPPPPPIELAQLTLLCAQLPDSNSLRKTVPVLN